MKKETFPKTHVSYSVSNIEKAEAFYSSLFEAKPEKIKHDYLKYNLNNPALSISFIKNKATVNPNGNHFGIQLEHTKDVLRQLKRLKKEGFPIDEEMGVGCCYSVQDKFWVTDPDGYRWEVYFKHDDKKYDQIVNDQEKVEESCCGPACCS